MCRFSLFIRDVLFLDEKESGENLEKPFVLDYGEEDSTRWVSSRDALARELGCSTRLVAQMLLEQGNPSRNANGTYDLRKWKAYFAERKNGLKNGIFPEIPDSDRLKTDLAEAVLRERRAKAEKAELEAARARGELIPVALVEDAAQNFSARLRAFLLRELTVNAVNELCNKLFLDNAQLAELAKWAEDFHFRFCKKVSEWKIPEDDGE